MVVQYAIKMWAIICWDPVGAMISGYPKDYHNLSSEAIYHENISDYYYRYKLKIYFLFMIFFRSYVKRRLHHEQEVRPERKNAGSHSLTKCQLRGIEVCIRIK